MATQGNEAIKTGDWIEITSPDSLSWGVGVITEVREHVPYPYYAEYIDKHSKKFFTYTFAANELQHYVPTHEEILAWALHRMKG